MPERRAISTSIIHHLHHLLRSACSRFLRSWYASRSRRRETELRINLKGSLVSSLLGQSIIYRSFECAAHERLTMRSTSFQVHTKGRFHVHICSDTAQVEAEERLTRWRIRAVKVDTISHEKRRSFVQQIYHAHTMVRGSNSDSSMLSGISYRDYLISASAWVKADPFRTELLPRTALPFMPTCKALSLFLDL